MGTSAKQTPSQKTRALKPHPFAELLPKMSETEYAALFADLLANGQRDDVVLYQGKILDGRHRNRALVEMGKPIRTRVFKGADADAVAFVYSRAIHRNMSDSQKAVASVNLLPHFEKLAHSRRDSKHSAQMRDAEKGKAAGFAGGLFGVSARYVEMAKSLRDADKKLFREVFEGKLKLTAAANQLRHRQNGHAIKKLKLATGVSVDNCQLLLGDNVKLMEAMPRMSIDCLFADSPYNQGWVYRNDPGKDKLPAEKFLKITAAWMHEAARLLKLGGNLFVVIDDNYSDHFGILLRETGLTRRRTIVFWETFGNYVSAENKLTPACRFIHHFCKGDAPYFNNVELRDRSTRQEMGDKRKNDAGKIPDNVWRISRIQGNNGERVPFQAKGDAPQLPIEVPERCILLSTQPGETVLDPFNGHGTTGIAALRNARKYIGLDRDKVGLEQSRRWIAHNIKEAGRD